MIRLINQMQKPKTETNPKTKPKRNFTHIQHQYKELFISNGIL